MDKKKPKRNKKDIQTGFGKKLIINFKIAIKDLKKIKYFILFSTLFFLFSSIFGYLFPNLFEEQVLKIIKEIVAKTQNLGPLELITFIMYNNIQTAFLGMILGIFFAIVPVITLAVNGYVLGFVANKTIAIEGVTVLWKLLPHGIFEIPAIMISVALGLRLGLFPFYVKEKLRAIFSLMIMLGCFILFFSFIMMIFNIIYYVNNNQYPTTEIMETIISEFTNTSSGLIIYGILFFSFYILSLYVGINILNLPDKKIVIERIIQSVRIFVFVIIPLLILAGIIEGILIKII